MADSTLVRELIIKLHNETAPLILTGRGRSDGFRATGGPVAGVLTSLGPYLSLLARRQAARLAVRRQLLVLLQASLESPICDQLWVLSARGRRAASLSGSRTVIQVSSLCARGPRAGVMREREAAEEERRKDRAYLEKYSTMRNSSPALYHTPN